MTVYILHFNSKYGRTQHYVGFTKHRDIEQRMYAHRHGHGNPLVKAVLAAGIEIQVAKLWLSDENDVPVIPESTRWYEKKLKREKNLKRHCPICMLERRKTRKL
jgi:hypothetical protein